MKKSMMTVASVFLLTAICSMMIVGCQAKAEETPIKPEQNQKTIDETLKSMPECSEFVKCAEKCGAFQELSKEGPMTVLVPVNAAYEAMSSDLRNEIRDNEQKEKAFCCFHILKGNLSLADLKTAKATETLCKGQDGQCCTMNFAEITQSDQDMIQKEISCNNGRIYLIKTVLIPECCKKGFMDQMSEKISEGTRTITTEAQKTGEWISEGAKKTGETVSEGAKDVYNGSRKIIGQGMEEAGKGLQKASEFVAPSQTPAK